jgi:transmembrane sensor
VSSSRQAAVCCQHLIMDNTLRLRFLFNKYLQRSCTAQEVDELMVLLQQGDAEDTLNEPLLTLWQQLKEDKTQHKVDWDKMYAEVSNTDDKWEMVFSQKKRTLYRRWYTAAAVVILVVASAAYWFIYHRNKNDSNKDFAKNETGNKQQQINTRQTIHLPDGSTVILNANSKLNYPPAFNGNAREVYLTGEGYFDIQHNARQPFLVHTGKITVKVLGTAFDIKAYPSDEEVQVTVTRGKVQVLKENKSLGLITASQQISFSNKTEAFIQKSVNTKPIIAWKPNEIFFNDITMEEAAKQVEQRFNMVVDFANPAIKQCRVSATFSEDDMPDEILTVICAVAKANYIIRNNKITIHGKGCS